MIYIDLEWYVASGVLSKLKNSKIGEKTCLCFFVLFSCLQMFPKKIEKMVMNLGGWGQFFSDFAIFLNLTRPLSETQLQVFFLGLSGLPHCIDL